MIRQLSALKGVTVVMPSLEPGIKSFVSEQELSLSSGPPNFQFDNFRLLHRDAATAVTARDKHTKRRDGIINVLYSYGILHHQLNYYKQRITKADSRTYTAEQVHSDSLCSYEVSHEIIEQMKDMNSET